MVGAFSFGSAKCRMMLPPAVKSRLHAIGDSDLSAIVHAAVEAGDAIARTKSGAEKTKGDEYVGNHAIVIKDDFISQNIILKRLYAHSPHAYFIVEEKQSDAARHTGELLAPRITTRIIKDGKAKPFSRHFYGVDSLDGSSQKAAGLYEWAISIGSAYNLDHRSGVIYAPNINGGMLTFGARGKGVHAFEFGDEVSHRAFTPGEKGIIHWGVDVPLEPQMHKMQEVLSSGYRTTCMNGSCALGLALVASKRVSALVQPTQRVWDWFGGYPLIEESGGLMQFFCFEDNRGKIIMKPGEPKDRIVFIDKPRRIDYDPTSRNLGFFAVSDRSLAPELREVLSSLYNGRAA